MDTRAGPYWLFKYCQDSDGSQVCADYPRTGPFPVLLFAGSLHDDFRSDHSMTPGYTFPLSCILTILFSYTSYFNAFVSAVCSPLQLSSGGKLGVARFHIRVQGKKVLTVI